MADNIELVIKIDKDTYNNFICNNYSRADVIAIHTALVNATPLPKGHGNLIDRGKLRKHEKDVNDGSATWLMDIFTRRNK